VTVALGRLSLLLALLLGSAASSSKPWPARKIVLGDATLGWILVDTQSGANEPINIPSDPAAPGTPPEWLEPRDVAASPNGALIAFTARAPKAGNVFLFLWDRASGNAPRSVGDTRGLHADPAFSADGQWLYFAHSPYGMEGRERHRGSTFLQMYRVRVDGSQLEALTDEVGCHRRPVSGLAKQLLFVHLACSPGGPQPAVAFDLGTRTSHAIAALSRLGAVEYVAAAPDGEYVLAATQAAESFTVYGSPIRGTSPPKRLFEALGDVKQARPQFGAQRDAVYYLANQQIRLFDGRTSRVLATLGAAL
jgi:hypothetical protein